MKRFFSILVFTVVSNVALINAHNTYKNEFAALKERDDMKAIFDENMRKELRAIQLDVHLCKNVSLFQLLLSTFHIGAGVTNGRGDFLSLSPSDRRRASMREDERYGKEFSLLRLFFADMIVVTQNTMPKLYEYIDTLCKNLSISTPVVFVTRNERDCNVFSTKFFVNRGTIIIEQRLLNEVADEQLEAAIAYQIGSIKNNNLNKFFGAAIFSGIFGGLSAAFMCNKLESVSTASAIGAAIGMIFPCMLHRKLIRDTDAFVCNGVGKGKEFIEFLKFMQSEKQVHENEFDITYNLLQKNYSQLSTVSYAVLTWCYYMTKLAHCVENITDCLIHAPYLGLLVSNEERIATAEKYMTSQQAA